MPVLNFLDRLQAGPVLFDGAMGTELYSRGVFINRCFEELNLVNPDLVSKIHDEYKKAGADVIETNTFGANRNKLKSHQLADKVYDINLKGAQIAKSVANNEIFVAGSVGPLGMRIEPLGSVSREEARAFFKEQLQGLIDGGVDLFILETFVYPEELKEAVKAVREMSQLPVIAQMTIDESGTSLTGAQPEILIKEIESFEPDVIGVNCTVGPQVMLSWLEKVRDLTTKPISIMPNAGRPRNIDGRNIYLCSPEYLGEYAKHFVQSGANLIGGCCGTTPAHIKRMRNTLNAIKPLEKKSKFQISDFKQPDNVEIITTEKKSRLARRLNDQHFVVFTEILSPYGVSLEKELEKARELCFYGIDAINIPDGPRASSRMSALALAVKIQREVGIEPVLHYVCRDRNVIGMQSDLLGAYALGLKNILAITGDPPKLGNYPDATAVFDVDSIGLVNIINRLNHGMDIAGNPIGKPTGFFTGVGANPGAINIDDELRRLYWKIDAGAEYIVTQPVFDLDVFESFIKKTEHYHIPIIAGIWPLVSLRNAEFMNNEIPGITVPKEILDRMSRFENDKEASRAEGIAIARETLHKIKDMVKGLQISMPYGRVQTVFDILEGVKDRL